MTEDEVMAAFNEVAAQTSPDAANAIYDLIKAVLAENKEHAVSAEGATK